MRANGGWFGGTGVAPDIPADHDVVTDDDLRTYAEALERNGFTGPDAWYMNHPANEAYAEASAAYEGDKLTVPPELAPLSRMPLLSPP